LAEGGCPAARAGFIRIRSIHGYGLVRVGFLFLAGAMLSLAPGLRAGLAFAQPTTGTGQAGEPAFVGQARRRLAPLRLGELVTCVACPFSIYISMINNNIHIMYARGNFDQQRIDKKYYGYRPLGNMDDLSMVPARRFRIPW
jgi:hypothetical protein